MGDCRRLEEGLYEFGVLLHIVQLLLYEILPIEGAAPTGDDLKELLNSYQLTKNALDAMLKSGKVTLDEIEAPRIDCSN
jgi:hypothetical protein